MLTEVMLLSAAFPLRVALPRVPTTLVSRRAAPGARKIARYAFRSNEHHVKKAEVVLTQTIISPCMKPSKKSFSFRGVAQTKLGAAALSNLYVQSAIFSLTLKVLCEISFKNAVIHLRIAVVRDGERKKILSCNRMIQSSPCF
jgi:hypothetical protein